MLFAGLKDRKNVIFLLRLLLSFGLIFALFWTIDLTLVLNRFSSIYSIGIFSVCIIFAADRVLMAYKWNMLLRSQRICITLWEATRLYLVGNFLGSFTPGNLGGDAYRLIALSKYNKNQVVVTILIIERIIGLAVIGLFALSFLPISLQYMGRFASQVIWIISIGTPLITLFFVLSLKQSNFAFLSNKMKFIFGDAILNKINRFYTIYTENRKQWKILVKFSILTLVEVLLTVLIHYFTARALNIQIGLFYLLCIVPIVQIMVRIPVSFEGIGVQEGLLAYFFLSGGFTIADGISVSILLRIVGGVIIYFPAAIILLIYPIKLKQPLPLQ